jgi:sigma-B regulation protein RsbU (phosphoserine phosphatase)
MEHVARPVVLVVDDTPDNITVLMEALKQDYAVLAATNGEKALKLAARESNPPDLILLDVMMPGMDGHEVLQKLKANEETSGIPVIFVTSLAESEEEALGLELGAVDYVTKPFNPAILKARLGNHLALHLAYREIEQNRAALTEDLARAAEYVVSQLPAKLEGPVRTDWLFIPSSSLGGDALGYHFPDENHFAFYLLDVCSHGVGPALLSVQALNVLRYESMPGVDFCDPGQVLAGLNAIFQMERHNDLYFTIVYGVLSLNERTLTMATAGHPPPLHFAPDGRMQALKEPNLMIGAMPGIVYKTLSLEIDPGSCLYLFSDGVYEVKNSEGNYMSYEQFAAFMPEAHARGQGALDAVLTHARGVGGADTLGDDFTLLKLSF